MVRPIHKRRVLATRLQTDYEGTLVESLLDARGPLWMRSAQCLGQDPDSFFEPFPGVTEYDLRRLCSTCPVIGECLEWALERDERGWWGGMPRRQRQALLAARAATGKASA